MSTATVSRSVEEIRAEYRRIANLAMQFDTQKLWVGEVKLLATVYGDGHPTPEDYLAAAKAVEVVCPKCGGNNRFSRKCLMCLDKGTLDLERMKVQHRWLPQVLASLSRRKAETQATKVRREEDAQRTHGEAEMRDGEPREVTIAQESPHHVENVRDPDPRGPDHVGLSMIEERNRLREQNADLNKRLVTLELTLLGMRTRVEYLEHAARTLDKEVHALKIEGGGIPEVAEPQVEEDESPFSAGIFPSKVEASPQEGHGLEEPLPFVDAEPSQPETPAVAKVVERDLWF